MDIKEFIDTYSGDLIYLHEGRSALLTHPLMGAWKKNLDASFCRMLAVFMIGSIEAMLEAWRDRDQVGSRRYGPLTEDSSEKFSPEFVEQVSIWVRQSCQETHPGQFSAVVSNVRPESRLKNLPLCPRDLSSHHGGGSPYASGSLKIRPPRNHRSPGPRTGEAMAWQ